MCLFSLTEALFFSLSWLQPSPGHQQKCAQLLQAPPRGPGSDTLEWRLMARVLLLSGGGSSLNVLCICDHHCQCLPQVVSLLHLTPTLWQVHCHEPGIPEDLDQEGCGTSCLHQLPVVGAQEGAEVWSIYLVP